MMNSIDLETKMFFRFLKVTYVFLMGLLIFGVFLLGWQNKPYQIIDTQKSYLTCPDGTKYSLKSLNIFFYNKRVYSDYDTSKAMETCNKHLKPIDLLESSSDSNWELVQGDPYPTHWENKTIGSWLYVIKFWLIGFTIVFLSLNGIKQSVLYIVYGKEFTFGLANKVIKKIKF